jgi:hypothetical protein
MTDVNAENEITQNEIKQNEITQNEIKQNEITQNEIIEFNLNDSDEKISINFDDLNNLTKLNNYLEEKKKILIH